MNTNTFRGLALSESILDAVSVRGYDSPTEIQALAIPPLLDGRDVLATAQTGTGKTAAFVLPILHRLAAEASLPTGTAGTDTRHDASHGRSHNTRNRRGRSGGRTAGARADGPPVPASPLALILAPTRELAVQIDESVGEYGTNLHLRHMAIYGGASRNRQIEQLRSHPHVVTATPGRLLDLLGDGYLTLRRVAYFVLDEGDRMMDMGFIPDVRRIISKIETTPQSAVFSATMPREIEELAGTILRKPVRLAAEAGELRIDRIDQSVLFVDQANKLELLVELIRERQMYKAIVFTRTKHRASKVAKVLGKRGIDSEAIHGDKSQAARRRTIGAFKGGSLQVLVATDVASRGLDIDDVTHVVNFEIPNEPETYVHRVGRTARAGADGTALSLCDTAEIAYLREIERLIESRVQVFRDHRFHVEPKLHGEPRKPVSRSSRGKRSGGAGAGRNRKPQHASAGNRRSASKGGRPGARSGDTTGRGGDRSGGSSGGTRGGSNHGSSNRGGKASPRGRGRKR